MGAPAEYIVTAVVIAVTAIITYFATKSKNEPQRMSNCRRDTSSETPRNSTQPPSPASSSWAGDHERRRKLTDRCKNCNKNPYVKINPCNHGSLCKGCAVDHLKNYDTCPTCNGRIDSCSPPIPPFGKCESCEKFTELLEFLPCNHSLSLCIHCFEKKMTSYKKCPVCEQKIQGYEPTCSTSGLCAVCDEFTKFAKFKPCNHGNFCKKHAALYLKLNDQECSECGNAAYI